jgi:diguanylate cyclase (GGDEF)-like protein/PAS domain S-box-containing protein
MQQKHTRSLVEGPILKKRATDRLPGRTQLSAINRRLRAIVENSTEIITLLDVHGKVLYKSPSEFRLLGYDTGSIVGKSFFTLVHDDDVEAVAERFENVVQSPFVSSSPIELRLKHADGSWLWVEASFVNRLYDPDVAAIVANTRDITEKKIIAEQVEHLRLADKYRSEHDPLTGVFNHREFHRLFDEAIHKADCLGQPIAVLLLDLTNFTYINDVHGHVVGDELLKVVANELTHHKGFIRSGVLPEDLVVARYGGDEFAVLLPDVDVEAAIALPHSVESSLHELGFQPPGESTLIPLVCSIGAAVYPHDGLTRLQVLGAASERLKRVAICQPDNEHAERVRRRMRESLEGFTLLDALLTAVDNKDRYTRRHSEDVMVYSYQIAEELGLDDATKEVIEVAALLHDVGKIGIPDEILRKPGKLTDSEYGAIKQHPTLGTVMVSAVPGFENTLEAIRYHHERWDGKGYPSGKAGKDIPFLARIIAAADAFSAMTTDRPYRTGMDEAHALAIIEKGAGTQWDPACAAALIAARNRLAEETYTTSRETKAHESVTLQIKVVAEAK